MRRAELEHAIRAAGEILQAESMYVIGSQSVLGTWSEYELPAEATFSDEVDICPLSDDDTQSLATILDGAIGELSMFHSEHGFYVQGLGIDTAILPAGWEQRLVPVTNANTRYRIGLCLDPLDACAAKLAAGREKDRLFVLTLLQADLVQARNLAERVDSLPDVPQRRTAQSWISTHL